MNKSLILISFLVLIVGVILLSPIILKNTFKLDSTCSTEIAKEVMNANNNYFYKLQVANCGATSDFVTEIVVVNRQTQMQQTVIKIKGDKSDICFADWVNESTLSIRCITELDYVYTKENQFESVEVLFSENIK